MLEHTDQPVTLQTVIDRKTRAIEKGLNVERVGVSRAELAAMLTNGSAYDDHDIEIVVDGVRVVHDDRHGVDYVAGIPRRKPEPDPDCDMVTLLWRRGLEMQHGVALPVDEVQPGKLSDE